MASVDNVVNASPVHEERFFLTAGESNARGEMPMTLIAERMIEVATGHANILGIGYATLSPLGVGWVLSRLGVELKRVPKINEYYSLRTWIESWNRLFSERCFEFFDGEGNSIGFGRTIWATIDINTRRASDLTRFATSATIANDVVCGMPRLRNHGAFEPTLTEELTFRFADLDFNRHVNSVKYIEHILNLWPLEHYDKFRIDRFDIAYRHECLAGQKVVLAADTGEDGICHVDIIRNDERVVSSSLHFTEDPV